MGEQHSDVYRPQYFGLSTRAPKGSTGVVISLGGERSRAIAFGVEHDKYRPTGLQEGQCKFYDMSGNYIYAQTDKGVSHLTNAGDTTHATPNGMIAISAKKDSSFSVTEGKHTITAKKDVHINDGNGQKTWIGESNVNQNLTVQKNLTVQQTLQAALGKFSAGLSTGALEVAPDSQGGLVQATKGFQVSGGACTLQDGLAVTGGASIDAADILGAASVAGAFSAAVGLNFTGSQYLQPSTGATVALATDVPFTFIDPAFSLSSLTLDFPAGPNDGDVILVAFTQNIGSLTCTGGSFGANNPTTLPLVQGFIPRTYRTSCRAAPSAGCMSRRPASGCFGDPFRRAVALGQREPQE